LEGKTAGLPKDDVFGMPGFYIQLQYQEINSKKP